MKTKENQAEEREDVLYHQYTHRICGSDWYIYLHANHKNQPFIVGKCTSSDCHGSYEIHSTMISKSNFNLSKASVNPSGECCRMASPTRRCPTSWSSPIRRPRRRCWRRDFGPGNGDFWWKKTWRLNVFLDLIRRGESGSMAIATPKYGVFFVFGTMMFSQDIHGSGERHRSLERFFLSQKESKTLRF